MISKVAVGVKAGAKRPDISTPDKLKAALLAAKTVGYSQGASGQHFLAVIAKLGIADALKPKTVIAAKAKDAETARALVKFLASEAAVSVLKKKGMDPAI